MKISSKTERTLNRASFVTSAIFVVSLVALTVLSSYVKFNPHMAGALKHKLGLAMAGVGAATVTALAATFIMQKIIHTKDRGDV